MVNYVLGFYKITAQLDDTMLRSTLKVLFESNFAFSPAVIRLSPTQSKVLMRPEDFQRSMIPQNYFIDHQDARIPFETEDGTDFIFTESSNPRIAPASFVWKFSSAIFENRNWTFWKTIDLCKQLVAVLHPDYGYVYDQKHGARKSYRERMFKFDAKRVPIGVFWINYYGTEWADNVGRDSLEALSRTIPYFESLPEGGVLYATQEQPYDEAIHSIQQMKYEEQLGLSDAQERFPRS